MNNDFYGTNAEINYDTGAGVLTVIPAWRYASIDLLTGAAVFPYRQHEKDEQYSLEARFTGKRIGFEESLQLMLRPGGFAVLVKRVAKYEIPGKDGPTVLGVPTPKTLFRRGLLHSSLVAHILVQKFSLGVPHYRLEQHLEDQGLELDRGTMCRYVDEAGGTLGATIVHAMWADSVANACVISTDATSALVQPRRVIKKSLRSSLDATTPIKKNPGPYTLRIVRTSSGCLSERST